MIPYLLLAPFLLPNLCPQDTPAFSPPTVLSDGFSAEVLADVNGDDILDLLNSNGCRLAIPGGGFGSTLLYPFTLNGNLLVGDINGDGKADLIGGAAPNELAAALGDGVGNFTYAGVVATVALPIEAARLADFNNDGNLDLMTCATKWTWYSPPFGYGQYIDNGVITIFLGDGAAGFTSSYGADHHNVLRACGDFDGDGALDVAEAWWNTTSVAIRLGDGLGQLGNATQYEVGQYGPQGVAMQDFDGDGLCDLAVALKDEILFYIPDPPGVAILLQAGGRHKWSVAGPWRAAAADLNGDGRPEGIFTSTFDSTLIIATNLGGGGFATPTTYRSGGTGYLGATDISGDGRPDLLFRKQTASVSTLALVNALTKPLPWVPWIQSIAPRSTAIAARRTPSIEIRGTGFAGLASVSIAGQTYVGSSVHLARDGNSARVDFVPPPPSIGVQAVTCATAAGASGGEELWLRMAEDRVMVFDPPNPGPGTAATLYFAGPAPGDLVVFVGSACLVPTALSPYVMFDIGGCGDLEILASPAPFDAAGLTSMPVFVPATLHGIVYLQYCDVDIAALLANQLPLLTSSVLTLTLP